MGENLTALLPEDPTVIAPDGLEVRILLDGKDGGMAHFRLAAGQTGRAVVHRTVEELWYFLDGEGEFWRQDAGAPLAIQPGLCVRIPVGTAFQLRAAGADVSAVAVTMPRWPGEDEATVTEGFWPPTV
jgi:mannose-6-phosphate isomerase-like protein (cupin superfamily)